MEILAMILIGLGVANAEAATFNVATCNSTDIQTAINAAANGDTINVPAGSCTWSSGIATNGKSLKIIGAGIAATLISPAASVFPVNLTGCSQAAPCEFGGFTFDGLNDNRGYNGIIAVSGDDMKKTFRIHHVKIINLCSPDGASGRGIVTFRSYGLIDHVDISKGTMNCSAHGLEFNGSQDKEWNVPMPWGSDQLVVVEASRIDYCTPNSDLRGSDSGFDGYDGMKVLFRFNDVYCTDLGSHGYDSGAVGAAFMEFAANKFDYTQAYHWFETIGYRSGTGAIHDNLVVQNGTQQLYNYDSFALLRMYRPWEPFIGNGNIWGGRGAADGNPEMYCDNSGVSHYVNACETDSDCAPTYGRCGARLCRRTSDNITPLTDNNNYPMTCLADSYCAAFASSGQLPAGTYKCDGTADGDRIPHPAAGSAGTAAGSGATTLTVSGTPWSADRWKWYFVHDDTDGSRCLVTGNTGNTITCSGIEYSRDGNTQAITGTLTGAASGASGTVVSYLDNSIYQYMGYVVLSNVTGTFQPHENLQIGCPSACQTIGHAMSGYGLFGGAKNTWSSNDSFHISIGYPMREGAGTGQYGTTSDPIYAWNNNFHGGIGGFVQVGYGDYPNSQLIVENRDFFNTVKPGFVDIQCPDTRTGIAGACTLSNPGISGYPASSSTGAPPPAKPQNLALR